MMTAFSQNHFRAVAVAIGAALVVGPGFWLPRADSACIDRQRKVRKDTRARARMPDQLRRVVRKAMERDRANVWTQLQKLTPNEGAEGDEFGQAVAISGGTAVIGAGYSNQFQGEAYVSTSVGGNWTETQRLTTGELTATDGLAYNEFGFAVALQGNTTFISPAYDIIGDGSRGSVYVFTQSGGEWSQTHKFAPNDREWDDGFGHSLAFEGSTAVIGAWHAPVNGKNYQGAAYVFNQACGVRNGNEYQGGVYVFAESNGIWVQIQKLTGGEGAAGDYFGQVVALSQGTAISGAIGATVNRNAYQGAAYVFGSSGHTQFEEQKLTASDGADGDRLGISVAIDGDTAVAGALLATVEGQPTQGAAYVFEWTGESWHEVQKLVANDRAAFDRFGASVALKGDRALIGVWGARGQSGSAWVFTRSNESWSQQGRLDANNSNSTSNDFFGQSVALSGNTAMIGAWGADIDSNTDQGAACISVRTGVNCSHQAKVIAPDGMPNDWFGQTVALSGDTALAGAPFARVSDNFLQGAAYVLWRSGTSWSLQRKLTAEDGQPLDRLGFAVAFDGNTALCSALSASFNGELSRGAAYIFIFAGGSWAQQAKLGASDGVPFADIGQSVALAGDTAIVGADFASVGGNVLQGAAYVFARSGEQWSEQAKFTASDCPEWTFSGVKASRL